jgi:hypothetical protein
MNCIKMAQTGLSEKFLERELAETSPKQTPLLFVNNLHMGRNYKRKPRLEALLASEIRHDQREKLQSYKRTEYRV